MFQRETDSWSLCVLLQGFWIKWRYIVNLMSGGQPPVGKYESFNRRLRQLCVIVQFLLHCSLLNLLSRPVSERYWKAKLWWLTHFSSIVRTKLTSLTYALNYMLMYTSRDVWNQAWFQWPVNLLCSKHYCLDWVTTRDE